MSAPDDMPSTADEFSARFAGRRPDWRVHAPGRINLIGEHTDYNGFPVLPMAIHRAIRIAVAPRGDGLVQIRDRDEAVYADRSFHISPEIEPFPAGDWGNYAKAAVQSLVRLAVEGGTDLGELRGMSCRVAGDIPPAAGLSSSTALVVAAGLAFCAVNGLSLEPTDMAERMAEAEYYVGTRGGGMDQAVCLLASPGHALKIDFFPVRAVRLPFPQDCRIVAAHSTVRARKTGKHRPAYNRRVLECRVAAHLLARRMGVAPPQRLADLPGASSATSLCDLEGSLTRLLCGHEVVPMSRAGEILKMDASTLAEQFPGVGERTDEYQQLEVLRRCRHVLSEAVRTERAAGCLVAGDLEEFGRLMDESHRSCADDYGISCPELDELVGFMKGAGALGARLTGAGFGGFAIALAHVDRVEAILRAVEDSFYTPRGLSAADRLFVFQPAAGASVDSVTHVPGS